MAELNKVIDGLKHCRLESESVSHNPCKGCSYQGSYDCADTLKTDALELLKEQDEQKKQILKAVWDVLHEGVSTDTVADQDWVYEQIRNRVDKMY